LYFDTKNAMQTVLYTAQICDIGVNCL